MPKYKHVKVRMRFIVGLKRTNPYRIGLNRIVGSIETVRLISDELGRIPSILIDGIRGA